MRKYVILISAILMQTCLGGIYAWSVFVAPLKQNYGLDTLQTQLLFGGYTLFFTLTMIVAGRFLERTGPRWIAAAGGILFGCGYLVASMSSGQMALLFLGISIMTGVGIGMAYVAPIVTCMRWFPKIKGMVTGLTVAGFGGGAIVLTYLASHWLKGGMDVLEVFKWVGVSYGLTIFLTAMSFAFPASTQKVAKNASPLPNVWIDGRYWRLFLGMFAGSFAGLLTIGNLKPMGIAWGVSENFAVIAISMLAVGNAAGRFGWGIVFDRFKLKSISASLAFLTLAILFLLAAGNISLAFAFAAFLIGFGYGACFVIYVSAVDHYFGTSNVGGIYPLVFLSYGLSGILGPPLGGWLFDISGSYSVALIICALLPILAIGASLITGSSLVRAPEAEV